MSDERMHDDYLWDRSGPIDPEVAELERRLAPAAWRLRPREAARPVAPGGPDAATIPAATAARAAPTVGGAMPESAGTRRRRGRVRLVFAVAAVLAIFALGVQAWYAHRLLWPAAQPWRIAQVDGDVTVAGSAVVSTGSLAPGDVLETATGASARLQVARIGEMVLGGDSRFSLVETGDGRHRTRLQRGTLWARIWAPPGAFGVATPAGDVFDLGCEFVLHAREDGGGSLTVRSGWVQIDNAWREVLVPEGARIEFGARGEPGIPYDLGASPEFVAALRDLHAQGRQAPADGEVVGALVAASRPQDAISLLYLLQFHPHLAGGPVFERMGQIMPAGARVSRDDLRAHGTDALRPWWDALPYPRIKRWWLQWPDAFSSGQDPARLLDEASR